MECSSATKKLRRLLLRHLMFIAISVYIYDTRRVVLYCFQPLEKIIFLNFPKFPLAVLIPNQLIAEVARSAAQGQQKQLIYLAP